MLHTRAEVRLVIQGREDAFDLCESGIGLPHLVLDDGLVVFLDVAQVPDLDVEGVAVPD